VTTRPEERSRWGSAARTTAAVPRRLTPTIRSQLGPGRSPKGAGTSTAAAVTTADKPP
jgi:hypothetical protein